MSDSNTSTTYVSTSDISYRTSAYISRELLKRAQPLLVLERFAQSKPLPANSTKTMKFRGYEHLDSDIKQLTEGVTPDSVKPTYHDITVNIAQYGDWIELTDFLTDTIEDPIIPEFTDILGEQAAIMREKITAGVVLGGTNVFYAATTADPTARTDVNAPMTLNLQRRIVRAMKRNLAPYITNFVRPSQNFGTASVSPSYVAICHTDCEADIRAMSGFIDVKDYGSSAEPLPGEIGAVEGVRYITTTIFEPVEDGGAAGTGMLSTTGSVCDVYPILFLGKGAFGCVPFARASKGGVPIVPYVLNPNQARGGDPLGQRGSIGWKMYHAAVILYDAYMVRAEVACSDLL